MTDLKSYAMLIDGAWVAASDGRTFDSLNPNTGQVWARFPEATADDVDRAVKAARRAFKSGPWASMSPTQRGHCLRRLADMIASQSEALGRLRRQIPANF